MLKDIFGKAFNIKNRRVETSLIESFYYPKFGPGQLWTKALKDAKSHGVQVEFGRKVVGIDNSNDKIHSIIIRDTETGEETDFKCDYVLSSMPIKDLAESVSNIPDNIKSDAVGLPYRDFITCGLLVDKLAVKNKTNIKTKFLKTGKNPFLLSVNLSGFIIALTNIIAILNNAKILITV